jgi:pimeloyl-ACP methyl ester carboxylesterase
MSEGTCKPGFERIAEAFENNFERHGEVGASVCLAVGGETVVDLWGGLAEAKTQKPWTRDTVGIVFSCTKGATALCAHMLASSRRRLPERFPRPPPMPQIETFCPAVTYETLYPITGDPMSATAEALRPPSRALMMLEGRAIHEFGAFCLLMPWLNAAPRGDGHPVLVIPGLLADDMSTLTLRSFLKSRGYAVHGWRQGRNLGLRAGVEEGMTARLEELYERHGRRRISLVGWSLGGIFARQLARQMADKVRLMISLGSPFAGSPKATNAWRVYEVASGHKVDDSRDRQFAAQLASAPPVPTTSIFSRTDGVCAWQSCLNEESHQAENIEVYGSHCGLGHHPAAVYAIADRLAQPEGRWQKFDRAGWRAMVYPDWKRP